MKRHFFYVCLVLCFLSGCVKQKDSQKQSQFAEKAILAKFSDIPDIPLHTTIKFVKYDVDEPEQVQLCYKTHMQIEDVIDYYNQNMERMGWNIVGQNNLNFVFLQYSKPEVSCSIMIQNQEIIIFIVKRKDL